MNNPLTNGKIVTSNCDSRAYIRPSARRGDKDYAMSRSDLMEFIECPSRWIAGCRIEDETDSTIWGSLIDCLLTDESRLNERFAVKPATYPVKDKKGMPTGEVKDWNANSTWCREWLASQSGREAISRSDLDDAKAAVARIRKDPELAEILSAAQFQVFAVAEFTAHGVVVPVKVLIDVVPSSECSAGDSLIDLKTARCGNPKTWGRVCYQHGYHVQAAMQLDVYNAATGENREVFRHIVQENFAPFEVSKPRLDLSFLELGHYKYLAALELYAQCLASGHWPTYDEMQLDTYEGWSVVTPESWMADGFVPEFKTNS